MMTRQLRGRQDMGPVSHLPREAGDLKGVSAAVQKGQLWKRFVCVFVVGNVLKHERKTIITTAVLTAETAGTA